jgi:hypothetical protein
MRVAVDVRTQDARPDAMKAAIESAIVGLLEWCRQATRRRGWFPWRGPVDRWQGTSVEQAYRSLHSARIFSG